MTWFKVDDKLWGHPKWVALPAGARALWVTAGSYCASNETDGRLSAAMLTPLGGRPRDADKLVECGMWERVEGGYLFHDWAEYQPTKAQVRAERDAAKERQRKWREGRTSRRNDAVSNAVTNTSGHSVTNAAPTRPDPSLSPPTPSRDSPPTPLTNPADAGDERDKPNGHTPARQLAATLLGIDPDSPRLDDLPAILDSHNVRSPAAWLRTAAANGDLEGLLDTGPPDTDPWAHVPHLNPRPGRHPDDTP